MVANGTVRRMNDGTSNSGSCCCGFAPQSASPAKDAACNNCNMQLKFEGDFYDWD